ncbi:MAG: ATP-binding protein [Nanoarchaeota archaeon]
MNKLIEAEKIKRENPRLAARFYLEVSEIYLQLSKKIPARESEFVNEAAALYMKAQSMKNSAYLEKNSEELSKQIINSMIVSPPDRSFKDIGGLEDVKEEIKLKIIEPLKNFEIFNHYKKKAGGGILMYGPPGCGKSLIAEATAGEAGLVFFNVKVSELMNYYVGETEKNIAELFKKARENQPCIIFFDEFEALGTDRTGANAFHSGLVSQLLSEMDGVGNKDDTQILLLAATNTPWLIDNALLREGRFGSTIFIPPPDRKGRIEILKKHLEKKPVDSIDLGLLADMTNGFSGADLKRICEEATNNAIKECLRTKKRRNIELRDFVLPESKMKPSILPWFRQAISFIIENNLQKEFEPIFDYLEKKK